MNYYMGKDRFSKRPLPGQYGYNMVCYLCNKWLGPYGECDEKHTITMDQRRDQMKERLKRALQRASYLVLKKYSQLSLDNDHISHLKAAYVRICKHAIKLGW